MVIVHKWLPTCIRACQSASAILTFAGISVSITVYISSGSVFGATTAGPSVKGPEGICLEQWGFLIVQFVPLIVGLFAPKTLDGVVRVVHVFERGLTPLVVFFLRNL